MFARILLFLAAFGPFAALAQQDKMNDTAAAAPLQTSHLRISLLTCGVGEEVYETFGHTGLRVIDSSLDGQVKDIVFNYGTFNGFDENFELKFMRGKLLYYVAVNTTRDFTEEYVAYARTVEEQELLLTDKQKEDIYAFLLENAQPENMYYKYDFFFDNCATRIRDIFPAALGSGFKFGKILPDGSRLTFRDIMNQYFYRKHWERLGVNILLGSKIDRVMTDKDIMFLPDYLRDGVAGATVDGQKIASPAKVVLPGAKLKPAGMNVPLLLLWLLALLTVAGNTVPSLKVLGKVMNSLLLLVSGLLGCLILVMWLGTDHQGCSNNYNVLWALPTNIIVAFFNPKGKSRYSLIAMILIVVSLLIHLLKVQALIAELVPLLLSLLFIHAMAWKRSRITPSVA